MQKHHIVKKLLSQTSLCLLLVTAMVSAHDTHDHSHLATKKTDKSHHTQAEKQATVKISLVKQEDLKSGKLTQIKLTKIADDQPITLADLKEAHTQKVHLLIIDDSLTDYHHVHPEATKEPGVYQFEWSPKKQGSYKLWADLVPVSTNQQEYVTFELVKGEKNGVLDKKESLESRVEGYTFKLSFDDDKLVVGKPVMGKILVTDEKGNDVKTLEPIMAAYAHIVGFGEDLNSVVHIHPMGAEPTKDTDRGGPTLEFHLEPPAAGFVKLFAQVKINGKELYVPFGININSK